MIERPEPSAPGYLVRAMTYDLTGFRLWEAAITPADEFDRVNFIQRVYRAELAAAKRELGGGE